MRISLTILAATAVLSALPGGGAMAKKSPFQVLYNFAADSNSGAYPAAGLAQDAAGNFYGTTQSGSGTTAVGTVFKLAPDGTETLLYAFTDQSDGGLPTANVILDQKGNLYGTASSGGNFPCNCGVVFKIDSSGQESTLYRFNNGTDGANPYAGLIADGSGNLFGTTYNGGAGDCFEECGTVFRLAADGTETVLHAFGGGSDGANPYGSLYRDKHGDLYGTAYQGGGDCNCGIVFKIDTKGTESILHVFTGIDGAYPETNLVPDKAGNLYGTTKFGGASNGGTVFRIAPDNTLTTLHSFSGPDGGAPFAGVIADKKGNLYGTTQEGGGADAGVVFEVTAGGAESVLYSFSGGSDGDQPFAPLFLGASKELYGTSMGGGKNGFGTVFSLKIKSPK